MSLGATHCNLRYIVSLPLAMQLFVVVSKPGDKSTDHFRSIELCELALSVATEALENNGSFLCKVRPALVHQQCVCNSEPQSLAGM